MGMRMEMGMGVSVSLIFDRFQGGEMEMGVGWNSHVVICHN